MKKRILKALAFIAALAITAGVIYLSCSFMGNPVSYLLTRKTAKDHILKTYPGTDLVIEDINYDFKTGGYYARVKSPSSPDTHFSLSFDLLGSLRYDSYEYDVAQKGNTARRLDAEYRRITDAVFQSPLFPYETDMDYGMLMIYPQKEIGSGNGIPDYAMPLEELVLDGIYDMRAVGERAGSLVIYVNSDTVTVEKAAEIMLRIKDIFSEAGIGFAAMDFTLQHPKDIKDSSRPEGQFSVIDFPFSDIYEEGMVQRVKDAHEALMSYYAEMDSKNGK